MIGAMLQDVRLALRLLGRAPGFAGVAIATLAIGIASNTIVFSIVNALYFGGPRFPNTARLVSVNATSATRLCAGCGVGASYPGFIDWRTRARSFASLDAYDETSVIVSAPLVPEQVRAARVSGGLFTALGSTAEVGRVIGPADDRPGAPAVVVLSHGLWQRGFGGRDEAIGRMMRVNGQPVEVIGVMPARRGYPESAELWLPLASATPSADREDRRFDVVGALADGVTIEAARREMATIASAIAAEQPAAEREWSADVSRLGSDRGGTEGSAFVVMLGAVGLMLAVACANLAALVLARSSRRRHELTVRTAMGASRGRLMRQLVVESLVLGALGGALGLMLAAWGVPLAGRMLASGEVPKYIEFVINWRVVAFCAVASIGSSAFVGLLPALTATRVNLVDGLKQGGRSAPGGARREVRVRQALIAGELALVLMLLAGASLVGRTFLDFVNRPKGYELGGLMLAQVPLAGARYQDEGTLRATVSGLEARLGALAGARTGLSSTRFLRGFGRDARPMRVNDAEVPRGAGPSFGIAVTPDYFTALGLPLLAGRAFTNQDRNGAPPVVVVNRAMGDALWPGRSPLGGRVQLQPNLAGDPWRTVVGVIGDVEGALRAGARVNPLVYLPYDQMPGRPVDLTVRTSDGVSVFADRVRAILADVDGDQPLNNVRSAVEEHRREYRYVGMFASFYATFGGFALLVAVVGLYGVASQAVSDRLREFGIRAALGADRRALSGLVLREGLQLAIVGAVLGLGGAWLVTRFLGFLLFGANPADLRVFAGVAVLLAAATMIATLAPALRASRVDPARVLKAD
jgi:putative ABC transport system permease protein